MLQGGYGTLGSVASSLGGKMGDGTFKAPEKIGNDLVGFKGLKLADFNNNGIPDLATGNTYSNSLGVLLGNGDGTFRAERTAAAPTWVQQNTVGDFNGDGNQDMAAAGWILSGAQNITDKIYVYLGNGDGTFHAYASYAPGMSPTGMSAADLNGDGYEDLAVGIYNQGGAGGFRVLIANGDGSFKIGNYYSAAWNASDSVLGDLNNDGKADLVAWSWQSTDVSVFMGRGDGTFSNAAFYENGPSRGDGLLADVNNDGFLDVVSGTNSSPDFSVMLGNGDGSFRAQLTFTHEIVGGNGNGVVFVADLDGDGIKEVVLRTSDQQALEIHLGNGDGTFKAQQSSQSPLSLPDWTLSGISGDVNSDGVTDIIWAGGATWVSLGNTRDGIGPQATFSLNTRSDALAAMRQFTGNLDTLSQQRATIGAFQSRISSSIATLQTTKENYAAAESRIKDTDVAFESSQGLRANILQQVAAAVLAQANQQPTIALQLLRS